MSDFICYKKQQMLCFVVVAKKSTLDFDSDAAFLMILKKSFIQHLFSSCNRENIGIKLEKKQTEREKEIRKIVAISKYELEAFLTLKL